MTEQTTTTHSPRRGSRGRAGVAAVALLLVGIVVALAACEPARPLADGTYGITISGDHALSCDHGTVDGKSLTVKGANATVLGPEDQGLIGKVKRAGNSFGVSASKKYPSSSPAMKITLTGSTAGAGVLTGTGTLAGNEAGHDDICTFPFTAKVDKPVCKTSLLLADTGEDTPPVYDSFTCIGSYARLKLHDPSDPTAIFTSLWRWYGATPGWTVVEGSPTSVFCKGSIVPSQFHALACTAPS